MEIESSCGDASFRARAKRRHRGRPVPLALEGLPLSPFPFFYELLEQKCSPFLLLSFFPGRGPLSCPARRDIWKKKDRKGVRACLLWNVEAKPTALCRSPFIGDEERGQIVWRHCARFSFAVWRSRNCVIRHDAIDHDDRALQRRGESRFFPLASRFLPSDSSLLDKERERPLNPIA